MTTPAFQSSNSLWPLDTAKPTASAPAGPSGSKPKSQRNRQKRTPHVPGTSSSAGPPPVAAVSGVSAISHISDASSHSAQQQQQSHRGSGHGRGRGGPGNGGQPRRGRGGHGRGMSSPAGGSGGRGTPLTANSIAGEDIGTRFFAKSPFGRNAGGPVGGASGSGSWRAMHTESTAAAAPDKLTGQRRKGGRDGKASAAKKAKELLEAVALKDGEEGGLSEHIMRLYELQRPSAAAIAARQHLVDELTVWLNEERFSWGHPHNPRAAPLEVVPFGSIRFGLSTATSDLDLCLLDPYRPNGFEEKHFSSKGPPRALPDIYNMYRVAASLRRANLTDVTSIADAAVPICKFKVLIDGHIIEADLNTNERLGVYNSRLINSYCNLHPLVRPLSVFVKFWAKQRGLNDPSGSPTTFSSYTYILLVISYLQHLDLLPNLQNDELIAQTETPRNRFFSTPKARLGRGGSKRARIVRSVGWDVTFVEYDSPPEGYSPPDADLAQLARGFFHYWADEFDMQNNIVSIRNGRQPLPRERAYKSQADISREKHAARKALEIETGIADVERRRQETEDDAVAAFAEQMDDRARDADTAAPDTAVEELVAGDQAAGDRPSRPDSRSSSPVEYDEYEEPERFRESLLVVQDPFILTRNTAGNVHPDWVEELRVQMRRARDLIDELAPLSKICLSCTDDPDYSPVALLQRRANREAAADKRQQKKAEHKEQLKAAKFERRLARATAAAAAAAEELKRAAAHENGQENGQDDASAAQLAPVDAPSESRPAVDATGPDQTHHQPSTNA